MGDKNVFLSNLAKLSEPENIQRYLFGQKDDGNWRSVHDVVQDYINPKKKKKKKDDYNQYNDFKLFLSTSKKDKKKKKKKKKKHKKNDYWHI